MPDQVKRSTRVKKYNVVDFINKSDCSIKIFTIYRSRVFDNSRQFLLAVGELPPSALRARKSDFHGYQDEVEEHLQVLGRFQAIGKVYEFIAPPEHIDVVYDHLAPVIDRYNEIYSNPNEVFYFVEEVDPIYDAGVRT